MSFRGTLASRWRHFPNTQQVLVPDEKLVKSPNFDFPSIFFGVFSRQTAWSQYFASIVNKSQFCRIQFLE